MGHSIAVQAGSSATVYIENMPIIPTSRKKAGEQMLLCSCHDTLKACVLPLELWDSFIDASYMPDSNQFAARSMFPCVTFSALTA